MNQISVSTGRRSKQKKPYVGLLVREPVEDIKETLGLTMRKRFEFLCCDILHKTVSFPESLLRRTGEPLNNIIAWPTTDLLSSDWKNLFVARLRPPETELNQENDINLHACASRFLKLQLDHCTHLSLQTCMIEIPLGLSLGARKAIYSNILPGVQYSVWFTLPLIGDLLPQVEDEEDWGKRNLTELNNPWVLWQEVWTSMNRHRHVGVALRFSKKYDEKHVRRWMTEPVKCVIINPEIFSQGRNSIVTMLPKYRDFLKGFLKTDALVMLETDKLRPEDQLTKYVNYIECLKAEVRKEKEREGVNMVDQWAKSYENELMDPLQPLQYNLQTEMYESFEQDPVKYILYQKAIKKALQNTMTRLHGSRRKILVVVAGAGRGPIVDSALSAAKELNVLNSVTFYAIDKNEMAFNTLLHLNETKWGERINVVCTDMRSWEPEHKMDIIVSELLGSFGDNELSPECLDGAQSFLASDGIIIPVSYTSYVQPIMTSRLYDLLKGTDNSYKHCERAFVVKLIDHFLIDKAQSVFTFKHPANIDDPNHTNCRHSRVQFTAKDHAVLHGFAGYFRSRLYDDVIMSILPRDHTENIISWWPWFIPIREPVTVKQGDKIEAYFFRKVEETQVWYEWTVTSPVTLPFHNVNAAYHKFGAH